MTGHAAFLEVITTSRRAGCCPRPFQCPTTRQSRYSAHQISLRRIVLPVIFSIMTCMVTSSSGCQQNTFFKHSIFRTIGSSDMEDRFERIVGQIPNIQLKDSARSSSTPRRSLSFVSCTFTDCISSAANPMQFSSSSDSRYLIAGDSRGTRFTRPPKLSRTKEIN
jgi:hypothetical protein